MQNRRTFYDRMAAEGDWDTWTNNYETQRRINLIFGELLSDIALHGKTLLDAGSGGGHFSAAAFQHGARVTSLDVGKNLLAQVAQRCGSERVMGSVLELPFAHDTFDVVMSTEVVEHTTAPLRALSEFARVLRPGGTLVVTTPGRLWQPVVRLASRLRLRPYQGYENFLWPHEAHQQLEAHRIEVDRFFGFNLLPLFNPRFAAFHRVGDRLGKRLTPLCVNFAIRGTKK